MHSIWQAPMPVFPPQSQDINTQVLIIGGGLAGVLCDDKWIRRFGIAKARLYLEANQRALAQYRALAQTIDCDFERQNAYVYAKTDRQCLQREVNALRCLGFHAELVRRKAFHFLRWAPSVLAIRRRSTRASF